MAQVKRRAWLWAYGSEERVVWVQNQISVVSGKWPCVNAHTRATCIEDKGGTSYKTSYRTIVPLTWGEHEELGQHGQDTFEAKYRVNLAELAAETEAAWQTYLRSTNRPGALPW